MRWVMDAFDIAVIAKGFIGHFYYSISFLFLNDVVILP